VYGAGLEVKWYGTTCLTISDGTETLLVDPYFTKPSIWDLVWNRKATSDEALVKKTLGKDLEKIKGILISHTHFDHIVDLGSVLKIKKEALVFGPKNTKPLLKKMGNEKAKLSLVSEKKEIVIGNFKITPYKIEHSTLPIGIDYARGSVNEKNQGPLHWHDFKSQESFSYLIEHAEGKILFHPTAEGRTYSNIKSVDGLIVGLTSRNLEHLKETVLNPIKAKVIIPVHHDYLLGKVDEPIEKMPFYPTLGEFPTGTFPKVFKIGKETKVTK
ncbi:MAG: MBL fold metallo-hydrolase, partial [Halobacteriovoraceae bacterium]|nr:MBL fold metallo-hydrolase [Halobacteriovoraceae bacterium]